MESLRRSGSTSLAPHSLSRAKSSSAPAFSTHKTLRCDWPACLHFTRIRAGLPSLAAPQPFCEHHRPLRFAAACIQSIILLFHRRFDRLHPALLVATIYKSLLRYTNFLFVLYTHIARSQS